MADDYPGDRRPADPQPPIVAGVDHIHAHARHTGHRWVDMVIALSAISISVISLFVAIGHGKIEERLVAANSWPFLVYESDILGDVTSADPQDRTINLRLKNDGVGPARVQSVAVSLDGKAVRSWADLMRICCGVPPTSTDRPAPDGLVSENAVVGVLPAREATTFLAWHGHLDEGAVMRRLNAARNRLKFAACYCSVLDECWQTDLKSTTTPKPVKSCPIDGNGFTE